MAEQKLYAVKLKDGSWWGSVAIYLTRDEATRDLAIVSRGSTAMVGARVVPVRLVEDADG